MSITYKKGCLIQALKSGEVDFMVHCCNAKGVMGSGIAKQVKDQFPDAYDVYVEHYHDSNMFKQSTLGSITISEEGVINLVGQESYGSGKVRYCNYGAIAKGLSDIVGHIPNTEFFKDLAFTRKVKIGIPYKFAADRAGGDWDIILELITGVVSPYLDIYIYHLEDLK